MPNFMTTLPVLLEFERSRGFARILLNNIGGHPISRLIRKDGHDLSPAEQKKEEEKVSQRIEKYKKKEAQVEKDSAKGRDPGKQLTIETVFAHLPVHKSPADCFEWTGHDCL